MRPLSLLLLLATTACSMTPKLTLPAAPVAEAYPVADGTDALPERRGMFGDPRLQRLIALSLDSNRDLRIAALNAEAARVQLRVQRQPASVAGAGVGLVTGGGTSGFTVGQFAAQAALTSFELDLFGRLFRGANRSWSYTPAVSVPIFRGGELRGNLDLAKLRTSSAVASYEKAIQTGFR